MKCEGPFQISRKLSPVTYQLCLPSSYGIHRILNIAHLERYHQSLETLGFHPTKQLS